MIGVGKGLLCLRGGAYSFCLLLFCLAGDSVALVMHQQLMICTFNPPKHNLNVLDEFVCSQISWLLFIMAMMKLLISCCRVEIPFLHEDAFQLLTSFLEPEITSEALMILQKVCRHPNYKSTITISNLCSSIIEILDCKNHKLLEPASKILFDLSLYRELSSHIISSGCIQKLVPQMNDGRFAEHCIKILRNLRGIKEALVLIAETKGCIASIAELLETGSREEQEHAVVILCSLCSQSLEYCLQVMKEGVIPSLVDISVNGNSKGKENSMKLLHLLKDLRLSGSFENSHAESVSAPEVAVED